ncbi:non-lysosomal glucosylceramidase-like [Actinia tenebrosa]|uniref:Non-lysosomal glucosylceramidase n=1 Tax=Actinia tenebrosa TaxID=6105 RepID=A0A6P8HQ16_ACTTE|nr:non-lysosomal glucosylceramidase-like [Actinia tenebrosa]
MASEEKEEKDRDDDYQSFLPKYGWRVHLSNTYSHTPQACYLPRWTQIPKLVGLGWRFMKYATKKKRNGEVPYIDPYSTNPCRQVYGVPLGGIGCGTIGRGWKGEFNRWQLKPGMYSYDYVEANQFTVCVRMKGRTTYQAVLSPNRPNGVMCGRSLQGWNWGFNGSNAVYHALYPRAWTVYNLPGQNIRLICRQVSPVFPHDYKDTSLPVGVFIWTIENNNDEEVEVAIMFSFQNGDGNPNDTSSGHYNEPFSSKGVHCKVHLETKNDKNPQTNHVTTPNSSGKSPLNPRKHEDAKPSELSTTCDVTGVLLHHKHRSQPYTLAIAAKAKHKAGKSIVTVTTKSSFDSRTPCRRVWEDLMDDGKLSSSTEPSVRSRADQSLCAAVTATNTVPAKSKSELEFCLAWDMPTITFGTTGKKHYRFYTRFFGHHGNAGPALCSHALINYPDWEAKIEAWQNPILQDDSLPSWYKSALFNELYFVADGGTLWLDVKQESSTKAIPEIIKKFGRFAYLEGHEYRMYNTYDVHFYASFALTMLWPKLQLSLQYDLAQTVNQTDSQVWMTMMNGHYCTRKVPGCVPHDIGDPDEDPWDRVNAYHIHDTSKWKDLNLKFVLQVYRDYVATHDVYYLQDMWPVTKTVMTKSMTYDRDGDGLIENSGLADQTYDAWPVSGPSAYCGGLWLAALRVMAEIATILDYPEDRDKYMDILKRGKEAYIKKLWNGVYYNYDSSDHRYHNSIMADQLAGQWYLHACDLAQRAGDEVFPLEHVTSVLRTIFENNVMKFQEGTMGAVNGMRPNGQLDTSSLQAEEVWTGVTYALGASMIQEGMVEEGFKTASGIYNTCFERLGMGFQTPEAIVANGNYRSLGYMRPLSIWAMQWALNKKSKKKEPSKDVAIFSTT